MKKIISYFKSHWFYLLCFIFFFLVFQIIVENLFYCIALCIDYPVNIDFTFNFCKGLSPNTYVFAFYIFYLSLKYYYDFLLKFFSYYVYVGKNNWYKFWNEMEIKHKHEDKLLYKEYLKGNLDLDSINKLKE